jgi:signal transduction histidine kinase
MTTQEPSTLLSDWTVEINETIVKNNSLCMAIFSTSGELLFGNPGFKVLTTKDPSGSFINPTFEGLLKLESTSSLIFDGFLTLGDHHTLNTSVAVQVYRKQNQLLVIGGIETLELIKQNSQLAELNREIVDLQHNLVKKSHNLEITLAQLDESNRELKTEHVTRDKLFSIIAHDLRSPFTTILGFSEHLISKSNELSNIENLKYLSIINSSAKNTLVLLDNLLSWAKSQTGQLSLNPEEFNLSDLIQEAVNQYHPMTITKNIDLIYTPIKEYQLNTDKNILKTIFRNLISNAIKFTKIDGEITISVEQSQNQIEVSVSDNGVGMDKDTCKGLFNNPINRTTKGTENEKGSGLGLILCKELVAKLGGEIWVDSQINKGSHFRFTILESI